MRVLKIGGRVQNDPRLISAIAAVWRAQPGALCLVHGGGDDISALQEKLGGASTFIGGRRVTSAADIDLIRMVLSGVVNKRLVAALISAGVSAVGLSGEDAAMLRADPIDRAVLGEVGEPTGVDVSVLTLLASAGFLPVVSPLARGATDGTPLNVNGDDAAAALAAEFGASELLFVADVPGVLVDGVVAPSIDLTEAKALVASGRATGGMLAKLEAAAAALNAGVGCVRIGGLASITDAASGTRVHVHAESFA